VITVSTTVKMGAVNRKVSVTLYNVKDVAEELGITPVAVNIAAGKAGVGRKDAGSIFFTLDEINVLRLRPGRGRPAHNSQAVIQPENVIVVPMPEGGTEPEVPSNVDDIASILVD
jgi:hypothetical protein